MDAPVTVVTGTRVGLGAFLARHYAEQGHRVIGCSRGPAAWRLEGVRGSYAHHELDVADEQAVRALFGGIRREHGRLDHLINNAGVASMNHALLTPLETVQGVLSTNVAGTFVFCREAAKLMRKRHGGRIVNFSTIAVPLNLEGEAAYAASKAAVESLTRVLAREFAADGITVNAVGPCPIDTDLIRGVPAEKIDALVARQAIPRKGTPEDVANVCDFYLDGKSAMVTGQVLYLGGV